MIVSEGVGTDPKVAESVFGRPQDGSEKSSTEEKAFEPKMSALTGAPPFTNNTANYCATATHWRGAVLSTVRWRGAVVHRRALEP